ncbi:MAG: MoaD/ThiS family protein [Oligoflexia bacterium]|nr:MoaD/ThiS family protein [Oligoflexia bacterium]
MSDRTVRVRLFGGFRKYGDGREIELVLAPGARVKEVRHALGQRLAELHPDFADRQLLADSAFASATQMLGEDAGVEPGMVLAVLPPVCGG